MKVDAELSGMIPPLRESEYVSLEQSILAEGCRDPLVTWEEQDTLLDGHNRLTICYTHGIPFQTTALSLPNREAATLWILDNQLARRNLTDKQRKVLIGRRYKAEKAITPNPGGHNQYSEVGDNYCHQPKTRARIAEEVGVSEGTVQSSVQFADAIETIADVSPELANALITEDIEASYKEINRYAVLCVESPTNAGDVADDLLAGTEHRLTMAVKKRSPHVAYNNGDHEWYTPPHIIEKARQVMGSIDCDPATSEHANKVIQAQTFYTYREDGRPQEWQGNVWLNPPYSQPAIVDFSKALCQKYRSGETEQACVLVNNATETAWFQGLLEYTSVVCFFSQRLRFLKVNGETGSPLQGQALLLFSDDQDTIAKFYQAFSPLGRILRNDPRED